MGGSSCKLNVLAEENQFVAPKTLGKLAAVENTCNASLPRLPANLQKSNLLAQTFSSPVVSSLSNMSFWHISILRRSWKQQQHLSQCYFVEEKYSLTQ